MIQSLEKIIYITGHLYKTGICIVIIHPGVNLPHEKHWVIAVHWYYKGLGQYDDVMLYKMFQITVFMYEPEGQ